MLETETHCIDEEGKVQFVTDTDDELTECQTQRKKLQSISISPVSLHPVPQYSRITNAKMKLDKFLNMLKKDISETYKAQVDCLEDLESDSYDKNNTKEIAD